MSQLLWGTLTLGLLVLLGVGAYSWWDMRKARQKLIGTTPKSQAPRGSQVTYMAERNEPGGDTTIMDTRIEPRLHDDEITEQAMAAEPVDPIDIPAYERLRGQNPADETTAAPQAAVVQPEVIAQAGFDDADIVSTAFIEYSNPVSGQTILQHLPGSRRAGSKPVEVQARLEGQDDVWEDLHAQHSYSAVRITVLLANRQGPLNEMDYSEFVAIVQRLAEATGGDAEFDDMLDAVKRARELDEFAAAHDALITLSLRAKGTPWSVSYLLQSAIGLGFVPGQLPGRMVKLHNNADVLLALQFDAQAAMASTNDAPPQALNHATLVLDVPQAPQTYAPLTVLKDSATALARSLDAVITDEQGRALSDETWLTLSSQLSGLYEALEKKGLAAGHAATRRVYS